MFVIEMTENDRSGQPLGAPPHTVGPFARYADAASFGESLTRHWRAKSQSTPTIRITRLDEPGLGAIESGR